jgi:hypothetical protein
LILDHVIFLAHGFLKTVSRHLDLTKRRKKILTPNNKKIAKLHKIKVHFVILNKYKSLVLITVQQGTKCPLEYTNMKSRDYNKKKI